MLFFFLKKPTKFTVTEENKKCIINVGKSCVYFSHDSYSDSHWLIKTHSHVLSPRRAWERTQWKQPRKCPSGKGAKRGHCRTALQTGFFEKPALFQSEALPHKIWIAEFGNWKERKIISGRPWDQGGRNPDVQCDSGCSSPIAPLTGRTEEISDVLVSFCVFSLGIHCMVHFVKQNRFDNPCL